MLQPLGPLWHVDRDRFDEDLRAAVLQRGDILLTYRKLDSITRESGKWRLALDGETEVRARYLVDATGRSRALARRLNAKIKLHDRLLGLTASVSRDESRAKIRSMLIVATPFGWWYAAPTPKGHVLALFTDADLAPRELRRRLRPVAANSAFTHMEVGQGWLPVGDACASHDPLCGWGVYRAMTNGLRAADAIEAFLANGDSCQLEDYRHHCYQQYEEDTNVGRGVQLRTIVDPANRKVIDGLTVQRLRPLQRGASLVLRQRVDPRVRLLHVCSSRCNPRPRLAEHAGCPHRSLTLSA
jgi:flavin-dependent dehydrogenase